MLCPALATVAGVQFYTIKIVLCISAHKLAGRMWRRHAGRMTAMQPPAAPDYAWQTSAFVDCMSMSAPVNLAGYGVGADHFRSLAASLPTGVSVLTTLDAEGSPTGLTCGTVCSLSCAPPLLLTCMSLGSRTLAALVRRKSFVVNVLAADGAGLAARFASAVPDKFVGVSWSRGKTGLPVLAEATVAHAVCELYQVIDAGDHAIVIGLILDGEHRLGVSPLMYFRRAFSGFPIGG
jgi:flavin reductase (DIM6/NTAB) family NADH-FMN oxidoreductase RutF